MIIERELSLDQSRKINHLIAGQGFGEGQGQGNPEKRAQEFLRSHNGRARAPGNGEMATRRMLVRLSLPGTDAHGGPRPHPAYGDQLQNRGVEGRVPAEGRALFTYDTQPVAFADGETVELRAPRLRFTELRFGDIGAEVLTSPRVAPAMVGLGLLEAVPEQTILRIAREQEKLGVSGRPNYVWDVENEVVALGRFGWKANQPSLRQ